MAPLSYRDKVLRIAELAIEINQRETERMVQQVLDHGPQAIATPTPYDKISPRVNAVLDKYQQLVRTAHERRAAKVAARKQNRSKSTDDEASNDDHTSFSALDAEQQQFENVFGSTRTRQSRTAATHEADTAPDNAQRPHSRVERNNNANGSTQRLTALYSSSLSTPLAAFPDELPRTTRPPTATSPPTAAGSVPVYPAGPHRILKPEELTYAREDANLTEGEIGLLHYAWQHMEDIELKPHFADSFPWWFDVLFKFGLPLHREIEQPRPFKHDPGDIKEKNRILHFLLKERDHSEVDWSLYFDEED